MSKKSFFRSIYEHVVEYGGQFLLVFFLIVLVSYAFLYIIDFIPEPVKEEVKTANITGESSDNPTLTSDATNKNVEALPVSITFDSLNKTVKVLNPTSNNVSDLDKALLSGVVRYPSSADFAHPGNIFILGHSSYLPNVFNKNFQAFNDIQSLTWGDIIRLRSGDTEYIYQVDRVYKSNTSEGEIELESGVAKLTLATCDSFGKKSDRFIVEASLIDQKAL